MVRSKKSLFQKVSCSSVAQKKTLVYAKAAKKARIAGRKQPDAGAFCKKIRLNPTYQRKTYHVNRQIGRKTGKNFGRGKGEKNRTRLCAGRGLVLNVCANGGQSWWALCRYVRLKGAGSSGTRPKVYSMAMVPLSSGRVRVAVTTSPVRLYTMASGLRSAAF